GYDSAGVAVIGPGRQIQVVKTAGRIAALEELLTKQTLRGRIGIGHTRWATHGRPSDINSHPHSDCRGEITVVHNGIIENYLQLREQLRQRGHRFESETDSEVVAHLVEEHWQGDLLSTVRAIIPRLQGSYALVFMSKLDPGRLVCAKQDNPLVIGLGSGENFIASDIPAIISHTRRVIILNDGDLAVVTAGLVDVYDRDGDRVKRKILEVNWNAEAAEKGGYTHFMLKEIFEQPKAIRDTLRARIDRDHSRIVFEELGWGREQWQKFTKIYIVACGTAFYAGCVGKLQIESLARIPTEAVLASEFRYSEPLVDENTLVIVISQSGETLDSLAALKEARRRGATCLAITNVVGSSISREADKVVYTWAGPEIAVASTKAYTTQLVVLAMLAVHIAQQLETADAAELARLVGEICTLPDKAHEVLEDVEPIKTFARQYGFAEDVFFIGRGLDYCVALEGALKLKEISYIHAEAYAAGELKHGTLALIVDGVPVIALATQKGVYDKTLSNIQEVKARDAIVIALAFRGDNKITKYVDHVVYIPPLDSRLTPVITVMPLQLLAYYTAVTRGCDVDKPRNLAKSVTVE
ncbi:MAG: glutamine--fructose-6-phosphate transaminase (isomerizing), partial [Negativicutes bacterium]|nr:glutamine--fructose-6-phosphate transaminase (isomerizing) [Negativicutes bacterium]